MNNPRTLIINLPVSNSKAISNALDSIGISSIISSDVSEIRQAQRIIPPGVGSFERGVHALKELKIYELLKETVGNGTPTLGVCLGLQLLSDSSEESSSESGLSFIPLRCRRFPFDSLKVPHVGWNDVTIEDTVSLFKGVPNQFAAYFCHSFFLPLVNGVTLAKCTYGISFSAIMGVGNVFGIQFHPERSQKIGLKLLENFVLESH